jgi:3-phenylpropionate/trans-cinnamate dioxygenase ferredoxin reductase subunit
MSMHAKLTFVIVGAGQAGRWLALTLRADGFAGRIVWFGDEAHRPYDRPPLSKAVLKGEVGVDQLALIGAEAFDALQADFRPGQRVAAIDRAAQEVVTASGERVRYDALFLANGGQARTLPGLPPHPRVLTLRTHEDALAIRQRITEAQQVLVLGGGWIGLEVAASARGLGKAVTVLEAAPRLCIRTVPACVSEHLRELHEAQGVTLRLGCAVEAVDASDRGVTVVLANGERLSGDCLIVGIGLIANDKLAKDAGLSCGNGVFTDAHGRTDDPAIFAVGDVANALRSNGQRLRIESWENAQRQAVAAAKAALGMDHAPDAEGAPWFWSDQHEHNLQLLGLPAEQHRVIERRVPAKNQRVFFFCDGPRIAAVAAVNAGREIKIARKWMLQDRYPNLDSLADAGVDLNKLPTTSPAA